MPKNKGIVGFLCLFKLLSRFLDRVKNPNYWDADNVTVDEMNVMLTSDDVSAYTAYQLNDVFLLHLTVRLCTVFDVSHVVLKKNIVILLSAALTKSNIYISFPFDIYCSSINEKYYPFYWEIILTIFLVPMFLGWWYWIMVPRTIVR